MSKLVISQMEIAGQACLVCAKLEEDRIMELQLNRIGSDSVLSNIYMGYVEKVAENIGAAFVRLTPELTGYFPLSETKNVIFSSGCSGKGVLRSGDTLLVQVAKDAMKGKLPSLSSNLNFTGKYLVLTTGNKKTGFSAKLGTEDKRRLGEWLKEAGPENTSYGLIVRTNAAQASKKEFFEELSYLHYLYEETAVKGRNRTCGSLIYESGPFFLNMVRDARISDLEEIVTDVPKVYDRISEYLKAVSPEQSESLRLYQDKLLPLYKLYRFETALEEIQKEKVWLKSGGFLVIQQTEAFVSIDVNSGKYIEKKKAEETYRKINLEAAKEIVRQLRLRNLSGIILIDFINMENPDHQDELFHILEKQLKKDRVKGRVVDITPLQILEMTRQKIRRPVIEDLRELSASKQQEEKRKA